MKGNTKRGIGVAVAVLVVGFAGLNLLAYHHVVVMMHFTAGGDRTSKPEDLTLWQKAKVLLGGVSIPRPTGHKLPSDLAPDCRSLRIDAPDSVNLDAWYCDRGPTTPLVMLFHGYSAEKTTLLAEAHAFLDLGCSVMLIDFRGSGKSFPSFPSAQLLVFWGGRQWGFDGFSHNPIDYAASVRCPALFMHGQDDPRATCDEAAEYSTRFPEQRTLWCLTRAVTSRISPRIPQSGGRPSGR